MQHAIDLTHRCPPTDQAYAVGAVIVDAEDNVISWGYSRESHPKIHAEESALAKLDADDERLKVATIYTTLEPCSQRASRPLTCTQLILAAGIPRVVVAWREPALFVADCQGVELLREAGVTVDEMPEMASGAQEANAHLSF